MALSSGKVQRIHNSAGKVVAGLRRADHVLQKSITTRHILRQPVMAIAFDLVALDEAERNGAQHVEIQVTDAGTTYRANLNDFRRLGFLVDRGYGRQWALALSEFNKPEPAERQLNMFGGDA